MPPRADGCRAGLRDAIFFGKKKISGMLREDHAGNFVLGAPWPCDAESLASLALRESAIVP